MHNDSNSIPMLHPQVAQEANGNNSDFSSREFFCQNCGRTFVGLFKFASHEKYHHKLPRLQRASQRFMHSCTFPGCTMEYVRWEDLQTHIQDRRHSTGKLKLPTVASANINEGNPIVSQIPHSYRTSDVTDQQPINFAASVGSTSVLTKSSQIATVSTTANDSATINSPEDSVVSKLQAFGVRIHPAKPLHVPHDKKNGRGVPQDQRQPKKQNEEQSSLLSCPHFNCSQTFSHKELLDKHIANKHKRGIRFHVVPNVGVLPPPLSSPTPEEQIVIKPEVVNEPAIPLASGLATLSNVEAALSKSYSSVSRRMETPAVARVLGKTRFHLRVNIVDSVESLGLPEQRASIPRRSTTGSLESTEIPSSHFPYPPKLPDLNYMDSPRNGNSSPPLALRYNSSTAAVSPQSEPVGDSRQALPSSRSQVMQCSFPGCYMVFPSAGLLYREHEKNAHQAPQSKGNALRSKLQCKTCPQSYWKVEDLETHILGGHSLVQTHDHPTGSCRSSP